MHISCAGYISSQAPGPTPRSPFFSSTKWNRMDQRTESSEGQEEGGTWGGEAHAGWTGARSRGQVHVGCMHVQAGDSVCYPGLTSQPGHGATWKLSGNLLLNGHLTLEPRSLLQNSRWATFELPVSMHSGFISSPAHNGHLIFPKSKM